MKQWNTLSLNTRINVVLLIIALALGSYQVFENRKLYRENQMLIDQINSAKQMLLNCGIKTVLFEVFI